MFGAYAPGFVTARALGYHEPTASLAVTATSDGEAAEGAFPLANPSSGHAAGEVALQGDERSQSQRDACNRDGEGTRLGELDVVADVVAGHHERQDTRCPDPGIGRGQIARPPTPHSPEQVVRRAKHCHQEDEPEREGLAIMVALIASALVAQVLLRFVRGRRRFAGVRPRSGHSHLGVLEPLLRGEVVPLEAR